eukprot:TRINITY_DN8574_c0_g1_i1.p1 TRINITY_DN8574_c0_g1~~TRINITY_DN8574_c0_g1_i1.p1  ORF type:complete len:151 (-),score=33.10 TRINITY_DN8574_c0_g1_i1:208-660(-)
MAAFQKQSWGSAGQLRDLDYVNPRQKMPSSALPPEVRRKLGLAPAAASKADEADSDHKEVYRGASNVTEAKAGKSGAGTNWVNPNGHAFVRRGSGLPAHYRQVQRKNSNTSNSSSMMRLPPEAGSGTSSNSASRSNSRGPSRGPSRESRC